MRTTRAWTAVAGVAAATLLAACGGSVGSTATSSASTAAGGGSGSAVSSSSGSSGSSGSAESSASSSGGTGATGGTINVGLEQAPGGYNCNNSASNSVYCTYVDNLTESNFYVVQPDGSVKPNTDLGTYKKTSDDPLTIEYTFADDAVWSDGTPIDFDDALLAWAAYSGTHPVSKDADGNDVDAFDAASTNGWEQVEMPQGKPGDKTFTLKYKQPYADWEVVASGFMPAHIVAEKAGLSSADNGKELIDAITTNDTAKITAIGQFWSTGFDYPVDLPNIPDVALQPSSGPYKVDNGSNGNLTLVKNDKWWGTPGNADSFVFKVVNDQEWVQAMANGDIDAFDPSNPSGDTVAQLEAAKGAIDYDTGESYTFSHVDFNSGPGGGLENPAVRQAFLKCIPREELVEKYARPVFEGAQVLDLREFLPAQANYQSILAQVPSATKYDTVDLEGAKQLLASAGVTTPYEIRLTFSATSSLRADQAQVIKASCDQAGFTITPKPDEDVFTTLALKDTSWDAALFGWSGSGLVAAGQSIYVTDGAQNFGRYSDPTVDSVWNDVVTTTDREAADNKKAAMEEALWSNPYNAVLYANPNVAAWSSKITGAKGNPTQYGITWNAATWSKS